MELAEMGFGCIGAIMANRLGIDKGMKKAIGAIPLHESRFYMYKSALILSCWKDSKIVQVISTFGNDTISPVLRNVKNDDNKCSQQEVLCPDNIQLYAKNARGVDHFDQMISYYEIKHRSRKWYLRLVLHFLQLAAHNSFILFRKVKNPKKEYLEFLREIIRSLISKMRERKLQMETPARKRNSEAMTLALDESDCRLVYATKRLCEICSSKGLDKKTSYQCLKHNISVCVLNCYDIHRNNVDFSM